MRTLSIDPGAIATADRCALVLIAIADGHQRIVRAPEIVESIDLLDHARRILGIADPVLAPIGTYAEGR